MSLEILRDDYLGRYRFSNTVLFTVAILGIVIFSLVLIYQLKLTRLIKAYLDKIIIIITESIEWVFNRLFGAFERLN